MPAFLERLFWGEREELRGGGGVGGLLGLALDDRSSLGGNIRIRLLLGLDHLRLLDRRGLRPLLLGRNHDVFSIRKLVQNLGELLSEILLVSGENIRERRPARSRLMRNRGLRKNPLLRKNMNQPVRGSDVDAELLCDLLESGHCVCLLSVVKHNH